MTFNGKIADDVTGKGVPYASIKIFDNTNRYTGIGTSADANGEFKLSGDNVYWPNYAVISAAEYGSESWELYDDFLENASIQLTRKVKELDPVIVTSGGKKDSYAWLLLIPLAIAASHKKKSAVGDIGFNMPTVLTGAAILLAIKGFNLIDDLLSIFGLGKDKDDKEFDDENDNPESPLKPNLYLNAPADKKQKALSAISSKATQYGQDLFDAFGTFNDDEAQAIGVFKKFKSQIEASCFAYIWEDQWGYPDLLQWLKGDSYPDDRLDTGEIKQITDYLHNLPKY